MAVEQRSLALPPPLPPTAADLMAQIRRCLISAADEGVLAMPPHRIFSLLNIDEYPHRDRTVLAALSGGANFDKGEPGDDYFARSDGARISFSLMATYTRDRADLISYRFHLQFPPGTNPTHIRFDLNSQAGDPLLEPRCHIHAGAEAVRLATPLMNPIEILHKLLYGTPVP